MNVMKIFKVTMKLSIQVWPKNFFTLFAVASLCFHMLFTCVCFLVVKYQGQLPYNPFINLQSKAQKMLKKLTLVDARREATKW